MRITQDRRVVNKTKSADPGDTSQSIRSRQRRWESWNNGYGDHVTKVSLPKFKFMERSIDDED